MPWNRRYVISAAAFSLTPPNDALRAAVANRSLMPEQYYKDLLRLIYRLLFLMVIEERDLVFPPNVASKQRDIYRLYYSVQRLRLLSERRYLADNRRHDLACAGCHLPALSSHGAGREAGAGAPGGRDLFREDAIGFLSGCTWQPCAAPLPALAEPV